MIDEAKAKALVEERISDAGTDPNHPWTPVITRVEEFERGWVVFYGAGEPDAVLAGNAPYIVDRVTGDVVVTGTARPIEEYVASYIRTGSPHG